jgi:hypothetical protein
MFQKSKSRTQRAQIVTAQNLFVRVELLLQLLRYRADVDCHQKKNILELKTFSESNQVALLKGKREQRF